MSEKAEKCRGCYNDDYNHGLGGAKVCWHLQSARLITNVEVHVDKRPPYLTEQPERRYQCYRRQRFAYLKPEYVAQINRECQQEPR
jgi:hypothetical protein